MQQRKGVILPDSKLRISCSIHILKGQRTGAAGEGQLSVARECVHCAGSLCNCFRKLAGVHIRRSQTHGIEWNALPNHCLEEW
jgi:hypothetical protein